MILKSPKTLVVYFSKTGCSKSIAERICRLVGGELLEIHLENPYSRNYSLAVKEVEEDMRKGISRPIREGKADLARFSEVVIGGPTWWYHIASPLASWLAKNDLAGKKVWTFNSHGGGGVMFTEKDFSELIPDARRQGHLSFYADIVNDGSILRWLGR